MSYKNYTTRMSCFALISAIESDIRSIIYHEVKTDNIKDVLPTDVYTNAKQRFRIDKSEDNLEDATLIGLLEYVDFYDLSKILNKVKKEQNFFNQDQLNFVTSTLENLTAARNRVCHSRPLEVVDFTSLFDFSCELVLINQNKVNWKNLRYAIKNLNDAEFVLTNFIPEFWRKEKNTILQNLPLAEFDDTGFLGRKDDRKKVNDLIVSNTRVISIIGEGGIGKTAIAQRCLYDILEICESQSEEERLFDMVLWVSLKTNKLTQAGAVSIKNAITNSNDMFKDVYSNLSSQTDFTIEDILKEILEYMDTFKILLCIDNLETISSSSVRDFLSQVPNQSKIIITTRMGLGEIEYRYKLDKMNDKDSIDLLRSMAKILNLSHFLKKKSDVLKQLCSQLFNNPLLIKWYILNEASGSNMSNFLNKNSLSFKEALKFCFENLYDRLDEFELKTISTIACLKKPVTNVEMKYYLDDLDEIQLQQALNQLFNSSMLIASSAENNEKLYSLTGIAEEYISSLRPVQKEFYIRIKDKQRELQRLVEFEQKETNHYKYDLGVIHSRNKDEAICGLYLKKAISAFRSGLVDDASKLIEKAKGLMPEYSEIYRVNSFILKDVNPFIAETELETAIENNESNPLIRYAYAKFLSEQSDFPKAEVQIDIALALDPLDKALITFKAWILTVNGSYIDAIKIYNDLLENPAILSPHKKFRTSTFDQAINCHRRYAERLLADQDIDNAEEQLRKALEISNKAIYTKNIDGGIVKQFFKLTKVIGGIKSNDVRNSLLNEFLNVIECNVGNFSYLSRSWVRSSLNDFEAYIDQIVVGKIRDIMSDNVGKDSDSGSGAGYISSLVGKQPNSPTVSFGFIEAENSKRYFFARNSLKSKTALDFYINKNLEEEYLIEVTFDLDQNEKGPVATNITVSKINDLT